MTDHSTTPAAPGHTSFRTTRWTQVVASRGGSIEAQAALNHPGIVAIYDFGQAAGYYFLLMGFVDGVNLSQAMKAGRFTPEQALTIVPPVCEASLSRGEWWQNLQVAAADNLRAIEQALKMTAAQMRP